jgi:hypothetical protein
LLASKVSEGSQRLVEKANHTAAQRWWRTLPDDVTVEQAQHGLDEFCRRRADARLRATAAGKVTVAALAATEPLAPLPGSPYPLILSQNRTVSRQAMVAYRGNRYSVPPELASATVSVTHVLGDEVIDIVTSSQITIARHRLAADGAGVTVRDHGHVVALNHKACTQKSVPADTKPRINWESTHPAGIGAFTPLEYDPCASIRFVLLDMRSSASWQSTTNGYCESSEDLL